MHVSCSFSLQFRSSVCDTATEITTIAKTPLGSSRHITSRYDATRSTCRARRAMLFDKFSHILRLWWLGLPDARRPATVRFPWQLHVLGTVFHQPSGMRHYFCHSEAAWRHGFLDWQWRNTDFVPGCSSFYELRKVCLSCYWRHCITLIFTVLIQTVIVLIWAGKG